MVKATIHDRLIAALQSRGETIVSNARSTRYTVLSRTRQGTSESVGFYFVGKAGALGAVLLELLVVDVFLQAIGIADQHPAEAAELRRRLRFGGEGGG